ncbi:MULTISPECIES: DUF3575 domain-containing protein [Polaribacter]|jgi:hypothetical protein|uniref:DUF3575 domain-containing protein n=1 Tax=Polaribacter sejongensis TaxID=985043 RepID=A0AAJ1QYL0_9FLAO|nr:MULTISPECIES: DUF3575 domain-containing protein [Polaribacter]MDN3620601.1 DUF3575 domain-containing protein [Polaribacter undariae]QXP63330.1 DUF3575 domain-containing protein [Polaribacter sp. HaHaR_3_91]QXP65844.1 DUF3575 domain-containing protein [Polaribacter sp. AHE13PA]QXP71324.1 DUF3575 domain-containing protein [Polaribacter sp. R2A056_3_33]UWD31197.1 DUF3575 domain-containing protein [Polaribacter undariae]
MKKLLLAFGLLASTLSYAQQEIKLDIGDALVIKSLEFSYENYISESSSFGISALFNLANQDDSFRYNENTMITPYYRNYFSTNEEWNFFGEAFLGINSGKEESDEENNPGVYDNKYTDGALGVAVGTKYITGSGLTIDVHAGVGRNLFGSDSPTLVPRLGVNIGWRF